MLSLNVHRGAHPASSAATAGVTRTDAPAVYGVAVGEPLDLLAWSASGEDRNGASSSPDVAAAGAAQVRQLAKALREKARDDWKPVQEGLARWQSITDLAIAGAAQIHALLDTLRQRARLHADTAGDSPSQAALRAEIAALADQIDTIGDGAECNGVNLLRGAPITETVTTYSYDLPASTIDPAGFLAPAMSALPPGWGYSRHRDVQQEWIDIVTFGSTGQFASAMRAASPEQVVQAMDDPLGDRVLPQNNRTRYTVAGGDEAGRVDMVFEAFELPDTMEVWQNGVRIAATGQAYAPGGGGVAAGVPVSGTHLVSFDYDPAAGPVTFTFDCDDPQSAWLIGGVSFRKNKADPLPIPTATVDGACYSGFGPVRHDFVTTPSGDRARISSSDLRSSTLGIDPGALSWSDPQQLVSAVDQAHATVRRVAAYLDRQSQALSALVRR